MQAKIIEINNPLDWLKNTELQKLLQAFTENGSEARIVGGAVRNFLLKLPISDIDIACACCPNSAIEIAKKAGFKVVATGLKHGTITAIGKQRCYEITSLRCDKETDGRHAIVEFITDWQQDALRRDFTINALYLDAKGKIYDYVNALEDIKLQKIRFIGNASARITEDYLRILRFFRFYAYYGKGAPDREALINCVKYKAKLAQISPQRIWSEFKKILQAKDNLSAILWLRQSGILTQILPQSEFWGIDLIAYLKQAEENFFWHNKDLAFVKLEAMLPRKAEKIQQLKPQFKLSNKEALRLNNWLNCNLDANGDYVTNINKLLALYDKQAIEDNLYLAIAENLQIKAIDLAEKNYNLLQKLENLTAPIFPLKAQDLARFGFKGKELGDALAQLKTSWLNSNCKKNKLQLLQEINDAI